MKRTPIKYWAEDDRPREKMLTKGKNALSDAELLAIVLGSGTKELSAVEVARSILEDVNNDLEALSRRSVNDLKKYPGIGEVRAIEILAVMEISRRRRRTKSKGKPSVRCSGDSYNFLVPFFTDLEHEEFYVLYLNRANNILAYEQLSKGGVSGTVADGKIIFSQALQHKACAVILAHNHPSGQLKPSASDIKLTKSLVKFGRLIDIQVLDHLIITANNYFSFVDEGILYD
ncbi:MAG: DNA repair protein RadC [Salibacteraceae bacterium]|jgi:DNA repair protein RadC